MMKKIENLTPGDTVYFPVLSGPAGDSVFGDCAEVLESKDDGEGILLTIGDWDARQDHHYAPHGTMMDIGE